MTIGVSSNGIPTSAMMFRSPCNASILLVCCIAALCFYQTEGTCGYESCNAEKPGMINVHLVPHTHDDVGWLWTVDQYYYKSVQFILDGVIRELLLDPSRRFIYVEIAFFTRWYNEQTDQVKATVKTLVNEGRLEFILGGWSMTDEAATHYSAIIDNHKLGFEFLRKTFGECARPKIGWQIDPFGHSREQASLFAQFGFDGLFFGRLDEQDKKKRMDTKTMEFIWEGSPKNLGVKGRLFTGILPIRYMPPPGFWWDVRHYYRGHHNLPVFKDDPRMHGYNVDKKVDDFISQMKKQAKVYATNHLIATMGSDFNYVQAAMWFKEMDKLIKYVNARQANGSKINLLYSTPSCYLKQLNNDNRAWTTKEDDFFPYADRAHTYWTGYFTSRPSFKYYARDVNRFSQSVKRLSALARLNLSSGVGEQIHHLSAVLGVAQHHDAITGTEKQKVAYDYDERLAEGVESGKKVINSAYDTLLPKLGVSAPKQVFCNLLNISLCQLTASSPDFQVTLHNPLSRQVDYAVRVPVKEGAAFMVFKPDGKTRIPISIVSIPNATFRIPSPEPRTVKAELVFNAQVPAMGFATYFVVYTSDDQQRKEEFTPERLGDKEANEPSMRIVKREIKSKPSVSSQDTVLEGKYINATISLSGHLKSVTLKPSGVVIPVSQNFMYYKAHGGNCSSDANSQPSGAYIFRPDNQTPVDVSSVDYYENYMGAVVSEVQVTYKENWLSQTFRVYQDKPYVEVEWTVGPIPIEDGIGKEVITRYNVPGWGNSGVFYTDANGREVLERKLNYRPTWKLNQSEPVAGNYFPVNAFITTKSSKKNLQFTVLTDRSQGGTSLNDGDIELMLHRRLVDDDCKGVGEALNETGADGRGLIVRGTHYLVFSDVNSAAKLYRNIAKEAILRPQVTFSNSPMGPATYVENFNTNFKGLAKPLPPNVHVVSFEQFQGSGPITSPADTSPYLIRLEHFYEKGEDATLSKPATFDIQDIFTSFTIHDVHELTLGANLPIEKLDRLTWKAKHERPAVQGTSEPRLRNTTITLNPMEIITLQANVKM